MSDHGASGAHVQLRDLPSVDQLAALIASHKADTTRREATTAARRVLADRRAELLAGVNDQVDLVSRGCAILRPTLTRVLNATGVVIHTNLGRAPLAHVAERAVTDVAAGYVNLELDLQTGRRSTRDAHVTALVTELTGAQDALVVNNGAAATLLAVAALSDPRGAVVISRGQLVEIGGGFRIHDVISQAGAHLTEVGTTNRTRLADYANALGADGADVILRVHQSNFRTIGFVEDVPVEQLTSLGVPVIDDLGSGVLAGTIDDLFADEPSVRASIAAGAAVTCFSGDKLLGGPQAGILVGEAGSIDACRRHPLARALRVGRLPIAALAATLALYRDPERARREIPVLAALTIDEDVLYARAHLLADAAGDAGTLITSSARVGGGALPLLQLSGPALALTPPPNDSAHGLALRLRCNASPLLARIVRDKVIVDPRTLQDTELETAAAVIMNALDALG